MLVVPPSVSLSKSNYMSFVDIIPNIPTFPMMMVVPKKSESSKALK